MSGESTAVVFSDRVYVNSVAISWVSPRGIHLDVSTLGEGAAHFIVKLISPAPFSVGGMCRFDDGLARISIVDENRELGACREFARFRVEFSNAEGKWFTLQVDSFEVENLDVTQVESSSNQ